MSSEITYASSLSVSKNGLVASSGQGARQADMVGDSYSEGLLSLSTTYEFIPLGDITDLGFFMLMNLGNENIEIGSGLTGPSCLVLLPGEAAGPMRAGVALKTPSARAVANTSKLYYLCLQT